jgi:hypothetical protein
MPSVKEQFEGYTRVTEILDYFAEPGLVKWMVEKGIDAKKIGKQAMKVGSEVDSAVKEFVFSGVYGKVKTVEATSCLDGFKRWYDDYKPALIVGERLFDDLHHLTGEPDIYWGGIIIDVKCAREIRPKYHLQTAAYSMMDGRKQTAILRLHKQLADYEFVQRNMEEVKSDTIAFMGLLTAYNHLQLLAGKENSHANNPSANTL